VWLIARASFRVRSQAFSPTRREQALAAVLELSEEIGLVSLRQLAPVIARLRPRHQLNILGMEALAAALHLNATVALSSTSPRLEAALRAESIALEILEYILGCRPPAIQS